MIPSFENFCITLLFCFFCHGAWTFINMHLVVSYLDLSWYGLWFLMILSNVLVLSYYMSFFWRDFLRVIASTSNLSIIFSFFGSWLMSISSILLSSSTWNFYFIIIWLTSSEFRFRVSFSYFLSNFFFFLSFLSSSKELINYALRSSFPSSS